jgi:hypothetical protein
MFWATACSPPPPSPDECASAWTARVDALGDRSPGSAGQLRVANLVAEQLAASGAVAPGASAEVVGERVVSVRPGPDGWLEGPGGLVDAGRWRPLARSGEGRFSGPLEAVGGSRPAGPGAVWWVAPAEGEPLGPTWEAAVAGGAAALLVGVPRGGTVSDPVPSDRKDASLPVLLVDEDLVSGWAAAQEGVAVHGAVDLEVATVAVGQVVGVLPGRGGLGGETVGLVASLDGDASGIAAVVCAIEALARRRAAAEQRAVVVAGLAGASDDDGPMRAVLPAMGDLAVLLEVDAVPSGTPAVVGAASSGALGEAVRRAGGARALPDAPHLWTHRRLAEAHGVPAIQIGADEGGSGGGIVRWLVALVSDLRVGERPAVDGAAAPGRSEAPLRPTPVWVGVDPDPRLAAWLRPGTVLRGVTRDGPAWVAGLRPGDRVLSVDGVPTERLWTDEPAGAALAVRYVRGADVRDTVVLPATRPGFEATGPLAGEPVPHLRAAREDRLTDLRRLTFRGDVSEPRWADDDTLLVVRTPEGEGCPSVWRLSLATGALMRVSPMGVRSPAPLPGGGFVATVAACPAEARPADADLRAFGVAGAGDAGQPVRAQPGYEGEADVCGDVLAWTAEVDGDAEIFVGPLAGGGARWTSAPGWDGAARLDAACERLVARRATSGASEVLWSASGSERSVTAWGATSWAPEPLDDGRVLLTSNLGSEGTFDLWVAGGAEPERLTWHPGFDGEAAVSPDRRWVAFVSDRAGDGPDLFVARWLIADRSFRSPGRPRSR